MGVPSSCGGSSQRSCSINSTALTPLLGGCGEMRAQTEEVSLCMHVGTMLTHYTMMAYLPDRSGMRHGACRCRYARPVDLT